MNVPPDALDKLSLLGSAIGAFWGVALPVAGGVLTYWGIEWGKLWRKRISPREGELLRFVHGSETTPDKYELGRFLVSVALHAAEPHVELGGKVYPHAKTTQRGKRQEMRAVRRLLRKGHVVLVAGNGREGTLQLTDSGRQSAAKFMVGLDGRRSRFWRVRMWIWSFIVDW